jgi:hypothetical protein
MSENSAMSRIYAARAGLPTTSCRGVNDLNVFLIRGELALGEEATMTDLVFIVIAIAFFGLAIAYTYGCARLQGGPHD